LGQLAQKRLEARKILEGALRNLLTDSRWEVRDTAIEVAYNSDNINDLIFKEIINRLSDDENYVRVTTLKILKEIIANSNAKLDQIIQNILSCLSDKECDVRCACIYTLISTISKGYLPQITSELTLHIRHLWDEEDWEIRIAVINLLQQIFKFSNLDTLLILHAEYIILHSVEDSHRLVRREACLIIQYLCNTMKQIDLEGDFGTKLMKIDINTIIKGTEITEVYGHPEDEFLSSLQVNENNEIDCVD